MSDEAPCGAPGEDFAPQALLGFPVAALRAASENAAGFVYPLHKESSQSELPKPHLMSDGSPCGAYGLSLLQEKSLIEQVAAVAGTNTEAARIALEGTHFAFEEAMELIIHGQWVSPSETSQHARATSKRNLSQTVMDICDVDMETAAAVLKSNGNDAESAIEMLTLGQWNPDAVSVQPTNTSACCHEFQESSGEDEDFPPNVAPDVTGDQSDPTKPFVKGDYACYLRTGETARVLSVHTENGGANF
jgi:hypothetical protein